MILHLQGGEKLNISDQDGNKIKEILMSQNPPLFIEIGGQTIKTNTIKAVLKNGESFQQAHQEFYWSDEDLETWGEEVFNEELGIKTFNEYLIREGAIVINSHYPEGIVKDPEKYRMLQEKWSKLNALRNKREENKDFSDIKAKIKGSIRSFKKKVSIEPIEESEEQIDDIKRQL